MNTSRQKLLVLSLGTTGGHPRYAFKVCECFPSDLNFMMLVNEGADFKFQLRENVISINTFSSLIQMVIKTLFWLPFWILKNLKFFKSFDVVYVPYPHPWHTFIGLIMSAFNKKIIFTIHDAQSHPGESYPIEMWFTNLLARRSSMLIFLSNFVKNQYFNKRTKKIPFSIAPQGSIDLMGTFKRKTYTNKPKLLFLGRVLEYKGLDLLLEAIKTLDDIKELTVAGKFNYDFQYHNNKVKITNSYLSDEDLFNLLNEADILVLPYKEASQSGIITLGIKAKIPMIITNVGGLPEQLDGDCGIICEPNAPSLRKGIQSIMNSPELFEKILNSLEVKSRQLDENWQKTAQIILGQSYK